MKLSAHLPLTALRVFEAAARLENFRLAAESLNITQSAISHQVANLESHLGCDLFRRRGRNVELTEAGRIYYPFIRDAFERIDAGTAMLTNSARQELTVQVYVTVAARWMMPRLHALQKVCPDLLVRFNASHMDWEFDPSVADVGMISTREPNRAGLDYLPLFEAELIAVCSPALSEAPLEGPADVIGHTLLEVYTARSDWDVWLVSVGLKRASRAATMRFDSYLLALEAACDRQGIAIVPDFLAAPDLAAGRLVQAVAHSVAQPAKWYLVARSGRFDESPIARFRDWLLGEIARERP